MTTRTYSVTYTDGSIDLVDADFAEVVDDAWHFVRTVGPKGEERRCEIDASLVHAMTSQQRT